MVGSRGHGPSNFRAAATSISTATWTRSTWPIPGLHDEAAHPEQPGLLAARIDDDEDVDGMMLSSSCVASASGHSGESAVR